MHGHLKECIEDFGSIYAFWLFSFERMNEVLGTYHTNWHDISLQIMRRFVASLDCGSCNWPEEFKTEFAPLVFHCPYNKGSQMSNTLESTLYNSTTDRIKPLPPIVECAWLPHQKEALLPLATDLVGHSSFNIRTLFQKCKALSFGEFFIGSHKSRYTTSSHVIVKHPNHPSSLHLARIEFFARMDIQQNVSHQEINSSYWVAIISLYFPHEEREWFGYPTEVWGLSPMFDLQFISVNHIVSRVALAKLDVGFGGHIGKENVVVVSPLSNKLNF